MLGNSIFDQKSKSPVPGASGLRQANFTKPFNFSPKDLRPLPQAGPRSETNKGRKKRKTAILTDTPEKNLIEQEHQQRNKVKKMVLQANSRESKEKSSAKGKGKGKKTKKALKEKENESDDADYFCLVCLENYSRPNEKWIQCTECEMWSHLECVDDDKGYVCHHCDSDLD